MSSQDDTSEEYALETVDSNIDKDTTVHIGEDSKLMSSEDLPPKVENSKSFCKKWYTLINFALICVVFIIAMVAFGLSILSLVQHENSGIAVTYQQSQKDTDFMVRNLTSRTVQVEMLLREANMKLDEMSARLEQSECNDTIIELNLSQKHTDLMVHNLTLRVEQLEMLLNIQLDEMQTMLNQNHDAIIELNSSYIPILKNKFDLLDDKLKANVTTLKDELNKTFAHIRLLEASQLRNQRQLATQDARLNATANETNSMSYQVSNLQSVQMATQSQLSQLDKKNNVTASTVISLSSQVVSLKSTQALADSDLTALDAQHNTTVTMVNDLFSRFSVLQTSVHNVEVSLANQGDTLNTAVTSLDLFNETIIGCCSKFYN